MGGRGKTPVTMHIARMLVDAGERPAILSRGYKRRKPQDGVVIVGDGRQVLADLDHSGDEPLMMAEQVPGAAVLVCDVRALAGALAERQLGATVHVLDDGFQHRSLQRDIDIVIVTAEDLRGRRMPFGKLRSPVSSLARTHAVIADNAEPGLSGLQQPRCFRLERRLGTPVSVTPPRTPIDPGPVRVLAAAGIARPERFEQALVGAGWHVVRLMKFRDHHLFTRADVDRIAATARETGAELVLTTEKDAMRLRGHGPFSFPIAAVPLEVRIESGEGQGLAFQHWLLQRLQAVREARG
jgi:tetraacyldisaccharide 4'-kinase